MTNSSKSEVEAVIIGAILRDVLLAAEKEIESADFVVRKNRQEGLPDDPEAMRKLRLSFRRVQYQLETMTDVEKTHDTNALVRQLHDVGKPFGSLRDAEVLELRVIKALGDRGETPEGLQFKEIAADARRVEQLTTEALLDSPAYQEILQALNEFQSALPLRSASPSEIRPIAQRAIQVSWRKLQRVAKRAKLDASDAHLHLTRITAKRALYSAQAFSNVLGPPAGEFALRLDSLQKFLGGQHDQVVASKWTKQVGKVHPPLKKLANALAAEERKRADTRAKHWTRYWKLVGDLHPRQLW